MKKVLFIVPHLSTGGLPQYTLSLIKKIKDEVDVYCIEYSMIAPAFIIQRKQIEELLGNKFHCLDDDKQKLFSLINKINPDIIHLQEMPEFFMSNDIADSLYSVDRKYKIVETSHDSSFNSSQKRFFPDYFALISEYQRAEFSKLNIPITLVEYDIEYKERANRNETLKKLGLDPNIKHILNVGLFTPRKNQAEIFEYAKKMLDQPVQFHFLGNQADNFYTYWEPLLKDKPDNVKIWGERGDVDIFYSCMDLFLFTSRGNDNDKETSPLVIREAIGYSIPSLIYNLPVYLGMYDKYDIIDYLNFNDLDDNVNKILNKLNLQKNYFDEKKVAIAISTYSKSEFTKDKTIECVNAIKKYTNYPVICADHYSAEKRIMDCVDYYFYDSNNVLTTHTFYDTWWMEMYDAKVLVKLRPSKNNGYHGSAVHQNIFAGVSLANMLKYDYVVFMNFDVILDEIDSKKLIECVERLKNSNKNAFFLMTKELEGNCLKTVFFVTKPKFYLDKMENIISVDEYENFVIKHQSESNGLENLYYNVFKNNLDEILIENMSELDFFNSSYTKNTATKSFTSSQTEYSAILPVENSKDENNVVLFYKSQNDLSFDYKWEVYYQNNLIVEHRIPSFKKPIDSNETFTDTKFFKCEENKTYDIFLKILNDDSVIKAFKNINIEQIREQGLFEIK